MRKLLVCLLAAGLLASVGCHVTDYPTITDSRDGFSGIIRTWHRAYITPTSQIATIWDDGTDELINLAYQNSNGDQTLDTKNNFDPTGAVTFVDQTYCDWRFFSCEIATSWNPRVGPDNIFDFEGDADCFGYRSLSLLVSQGSRLGECGDTLFWGNQKQELLGEFANLPVASFRGEPAYVVGINAGNTSIEFDFGGVNKTMPIYGQFTAFVDNKLRTAVPMTPNARLELAWLQSQVAEHGELVTGTVNYGSLSGSIEARIVLEGVTENLSRF